MTEMFSSEQVRFYFDYLDGQLVWKVDMGSNKVKGCVAGSPNGGGYIQVRINGKLYKAHHLVWLWHGRQIPIGCVIDHINGVPNDNRVDNLRVCSRAENNRNARLKRTNQSGVKGVSWYAKTGKWVAQLQVDGCKKHLGLFSRIEDAAEAVQLARASFHGAFARDK